MRMWILFLLFPLLLWGKEVTWQASLEKPFELKIQLSSQEIYVDDVLSIEADFKYPITYQLKKDELLDQLLWSANPLAPSFSLVKVQFTPTSEGEIQVQHLSITLAPFKAGTHDFSFLTITFLPKDTAEKPISISTPVFSLQVLPIKEEITLTFAPLIPLDPQFPLGLTEANRNLLIDNPIKRQEEVKRIQKALAQHTFPWLSLLLFIGGGGIGWAAYLTKEWWLTRLKKEPPPPSPKQQANQALVNLNKSSLLNDGLSKNYYAELSNILLKALQNRLGWRTQELTTPQLIELFKRDLILSPEEKQKIISLMDEMDQIKFARKEPTKEELETIFQKIEITIQKLFNEINQ